MKLLKKDRGIKKLVNEYIVLKHNYMSAVYEPKEISSPEEAFLIGSIMAKEAAKKIRINFNFNR